MIHKIMRSKLDKSSGDLQTKYIGLGKTNKTRNLNREQNGLAIAHTEATLTLREVWGFSQDNHW